LFACTCCDLSVLALGSWASSAKTPLQPISGTSTNPKTIRRMIGYPKLTLWSAYPLFRSKLRETRQDTSWGHTNPPEFSLEDRLLIFVTRQEPLHWE
jgi:hypothetical protein